MHDGISTLTQIYYLCRLNTVRDKNDYLESKLQIQHIPKNKSD